MMVSRRRADRRRLRETRYTTPRPGRAARAGRRSWVAAERPVGCWRAKAGALPPRPSQPSPRWRWPARGENGDAVVGFARRNHAFGRDDADGRFDADNALQPRRHPAGTGGVGADRDIGLSSGDGHRGSRTGTAADVLGTTGVRYRAIRGARAHQPGRELVQVGLAHHHGACRTQRRDGRRILIGNVCVLGAGSGSRHPAHVHIVLDRQAYTGQRP